MLTGTLSHDASKEMSRAVEDKKPQESQKAKALWTMMAAKDVREKNTSIHCMKRTSWGETRQQGLKMFLVLCGGESSTMAGVGGRSDQLGFNGMECAREVRVAWRAHFLHYSEGAGRTSLFSADILKKCALVALHLIAEEGGDGEDGCHAPGLETSGKLAAHRVQTNLGRKPKVCLPVALEKAMVCKDALHVIGCIGLVTRPLCS